MSYIQIKSVGKRNNSSVQAASSVSSEVVTTIDSGTVALKAGRLYKIEAQVGTASNGTYTDLLQLKIKDTNTAGTERAHNIAHGAQDGGTYVHPCLLVGMYPCTTDETKTFVVTAQRIAGTATWNVWRTGATSQMTYCTVTDIGPTADVVTL